MILRKKRRYIMPVVAGVTSYAVALLLSLAIDRWQWPAMRIYVLGFLGVLAATVSGVLAEERVEKQVKDRARELETEFDQAQEAHRQSNRAFCEENIKRTLRQAAITLVPPDTPVRTNLFLVDNLENALYVAYHYGMDNAPDLGIRLGPRAGCAGHAWNLKEWVVADLSHSPENELRRVWKLASEQVPLTINLKAILAIPVFHPKTPEKVVGVFNVDSFEPIADTLRQRETVENAERMGVLLAAFLWLGEIVERGE